MSGADDCLARYPDLPEGSGFHIEASLWPPGGTCVYELANGQRTTRANEVPVFDWIIFAVVACLIGAVTWAALAIARCGGTSRR